jgi:hypothetical protein
MGDQVVGRADLISVCRTASKRHNPPGAGPASVTQTLKLDAAASLAHQSKAIAAMSIMLKAQAAM